jgi:hypothetical protein
MAGFCLSDVWIRYRLQRKAAPGVGAAYQFYDEAPGLGGKVGWGIQGALMSSI